MTESKKILGRITLMLNELMRVTSSGSSYFIKNNVLYKQRASIRNQDFNVYNSYSVFLPVPAADLAAEEKLLIDIYEKTLQEKNYNEYGDEDGLAWPDLRPLSALFLSLEEQRIKALLNRFTKLKTFEDRVYFILNERVVYQVVSEIDNEPRIEKVFSESLVKELEYSALTLLQTAVKMDEVYNQCYYRQGLAYTQNGK